VLDSPGVRERVCCCCVVRALGRAYAHGRCICLPYTRAQCDEFGNLSVQVLGQWYNCGEQPMCERCVVRVCVR
jgi:hypothetical protein